jgi:hypothetical protein
MDANSKLKKNAEDQVTRLMAQLSDLEELRSVSQESTPSGQKSTPSGRESTPFCHR